MINFFPTFLMTSSFYIFLRLIETENTYISANSMCAFKQMRNILTNVITKEK